MRSWASVVGGQKVPQGRAYKENSNNNVDPKTFWRKFDRGKGYSTGESTTKPVLKRQDAPQGAADIEAPRTPPRTPLRTPKQESKQHTKPSPLKLSPSKYHMKRGGYKKSGRPLGRTAHKVKKMMDGLYPGSPHSPPANKGEALPVSDQSTRAAQGFLQKLFEHEGFSAYLEQHVEKRKQEFNLGSYPCIGFLTYYVGNELRCLVSLSGHSSTSNQRRGQFIADFWKYVEEVTRSFEGYTFLDYESKNYSRLVSLISPNKHTNNRSTHKSCAEKKAFACFSKLCAEAGEDMMPSGDGFCPVKFEFCESKKRNTRSQWLQVKAGNQVSYLEIIPPCAACKKNAAAYRGIFDAATGLNPSSPRSLFKEDEAKTDQCPSKSIRRKLFC